MSPEERGLVRRLAAEVGDALAEEQQRREAAGRVRLDDVGREGLAEQLTRAALGRLASERLSRREQMLDGDAEDRVAEAVIDRVCGTRGFARYLARDDVEEIVFNSHDNVWIYLADGTRLMGEAVAETPAELVEDTRLLASTAGKTERRFDAGSPRLNLRLPDGSRLYAVMDVTGDSPAGAIRRSRYPEMDLDQMMDLGTIDKALHSLMGAMVRSGMRVVISGETGSGKTATLRALVALLDRSDRVIAIEDTAELDLARLRGPGSNTLELEARQANVEGAGEITQRDLVRDALRLRPDWLVMAEVRGGEALDMLTAMSHGRRSLSTIHAARVADVPEKLALYCLLAPERVPIEATHYLVHMSVDFIVHLQEFPGERRAVVEVAEVAQYDEKAQKVQLNRVFSPGPDGRAVPGSPTSAGGGHLTSERLDRLVAAGFDDGLLANPRGWWS
jgi:Flp pilus assembly CpaF family ATPase